MLSRIEVRRANADDANVLVSMIRELAIVNKDGATITVEQLREDGFRDRPWFSSLIAERDENPIGYAFWYLGYNANSGSRILHLHHLYVQRDHRRSGVGRALVTALVREALNQSCAVLVLSVFAENEKAMAFYRALGFHCEDPPSPRFYIGQPEMKTMVSRLPEIEAG